MIEIEENFTNIIKHLEQYHNTLGEIRTIKPLVGGTVNSNYLIHSTKGEWVFTILNVLSLDLAIEIGEYITFLNQKQFPTPVLQYTDNQKAVLIFQNKPSLVVNYLKGTSPVYPTLDECKQIGLILGKLHKISYDFKAPIINTMDNQWRYQAAQTLMPKFNTLEQHYIKTTLEAQANLPYDTLPKGMIHFDLFRDNTIFKNHTLLGIIDFYYACYDILLSDLCIAINDWCTDWEAPNRVLLTHKVNILINHYQSIRPLTEVEIQMLPTVQKICALHFWLARSLSTKKDPSDYQKIFLNLCR